MDPLGKSDLCFELHVEISGKNIVFCYDMISTRLFCLSKGFRFSSTTWVEIRVLVVFVLEHNTNPAIATRPIVIAAFIFLGLNLFMQNRLIVQP
jgi:hypothetical protein